MKRESQTYEIEGNTSINTTITSQQDVLSDIRSINGITIVSFTPANIDDPTLVLDNTNYKGILDIKIDTYPFENFDKKVQLKSIVENIRKIPAINFFRPTLVNLLENESI